MKKHLFFTLLAIVFAVKIDEPVIASGLLFFAITYAAFLGRFNPNILSLCLGLLGFIIIERIIFLFVSKNNTPLVWTNHIIFSIHFAMDLGCIFFLIYRGVLCRWLYRNYLYTVQKFHLTNADISMLLVMVLFLLVDLAAMAENLLRNLEHLGVSEELAKPLWELNWIFYHYPELKASIMGLQFLVLWSTVTKMARQQSRFLRRFQA